MLLFVRQRISIHTIFDTIGLLFDELLDRDDLNIEPDIYPDFD